MDNLEKELGRIVNTLKKERKARLADCIEKNWDKTALAYSKELNSWRPTRPMEKELLEAFGKELERSEINQHFKTEILNSLKKRRILQTAPHLGATEGPRMLCINWLGSLGVSPKDFYIVGMFSGVPFSNRSRPGRINREKNSINLFPSTMQDAMVYRSIVPDKLVESTDKLPEEIYRFLPKATKQESYTKWALESCQYIERKILGKRNLVYIDMNEVITEYLLKVLKKPTHIFYKIFFDPKIQEEFLKIFSDEVMFYAPFMDGKYEKMKKITLQDLKSEQNLIKGLREKRWCPALLTSFMATAFLNQFKCFGSFAQVEYLPVYQEKLAKMKCMKGFGVEKVPTSNLTTGVFPEIHNLYPADMILSNSLKKFKPDGKILFGELLLPMKDVLLESYFTGDSRNGKK